MRVSQGCFLNRGFPRRREAVGEGEIELERLASVEFEIRPKLLIDQRPDQPGRDHSSIRARRLLRTASLCPAEAGQADGPIRGSARHLLARVLSGTSRVSTSAPELVVIDFLPQHAVEP